MSSNLQSKAMIVTLSASMWGAAKNDKDLADTLIEQNDAQEGAARVRKQLLSAESLKPIKSAVDATKSIHNRMTLPWSDNGERLLPVKMHDAYRDAMIAAIDRVDQAVATFIDEYENLIAGARVTLGQMFDENDYPASGTIRQKFGVVYDISPVPTSAHFVADIGDEEAERIKAEIDRRSQAKLDSAMVRLYERVEESTQRLITRLGHDEDGNPRPVHASALDALRSIAESVPSLNLTDDKRLAEIAEKINTALGHVEIDDLRHKSKKMSNIQATTTRRNDLATELSSIASAYFGSPPEAGNRVEDAV